MPLRLFSTTYCPYAWCTRIVLHEKGIPFEVFEVDLKAKQEDFLRVSPTGKVPVLGVCLGHQSIGEAFGGDVIRAPQLMHGKTDSIYHDGGPLFAGLPNPFTATRYHSLVIEPQSLPKELVVTAWTNLPEGGREIMAVQHREFPLFGLQSHPESFLTLDGAEMLRRFLAV